MAHTDDRLDVMQLQECRHYVHGGLQQGGGDVHVIIVVLRADEPPHACRIAANLWIGLSG